MGGNRVSIVETVGALLRFLMSAHRADEKSATGLVCEERSNEVPNFDKCFLPIISAGETHFCGCAIRDEVWMIIRMCVDHYCIRHCL